MSKFLRWFGSDLSVGLGSGVEVQIVDAVIDLDESGGVLGIEMLGLMVRRPALETVAETSTSPRVSVDSEADAVYVRLAHGRSVDQIVRVAAVAFDQSDRLVGLAVRMEQ